MISSSNDEVITIQKLTIVGTGQYIYDETTRLQLWNYVPNKKSITDVKHAMRVNLGLEKTELVKTFSYSIKEGYELKSIGAGPYSTYTTYDLLIDLTKKDVTSAETWAKKNNITLTIEYVSDLNYSNGKIISQDYPVNKRLDKIENRTVTIKVVKNEELSLPKVDCLVDINNEVCILPDFTFKTKNDVTIWGSKFSNTVALYFEYKESSEADGTIISQSVEKGTTVKDIVENNITITITISKNKDNTEDNNIGDSGSNENENENTTPPENNNSEDSNNDNVQEDE
jgi:beta-lactam-binding protein with PASTA domain